MMNQAVISMTVANSMETASTPSTKIDNSVKPPVLQQQGLPLSAFFAIVLNSDASVKILSNNSSRVEWKPLTEFHCFPKLPLEVRRMVWDFSLPGPRKVDIGCHKPCMSDPDGDFEEIRDRGVDSPTLPIALHICHESRVEALKKYHIIHRHRSYSEDKHYTPEQGDKKPICINPAIDHAFFHWNDVTHRNMKEYDWIDSITLFHPAVYEAVTEVEVRGVDFEFLQWATEIDPYLIDASWFHRRHSIFGTTFALPNIKKLHIHFDPRTCRTKCPGLPLREKLAANTLSFTTSFQYTGGSTLQVEVHRWQTIKEWVANLRRI